jgi:murein DD-endopeptidase MepM/ murein hydrolase activator NlpD
MRSLQFPHGLPEALEDDVLPLNRHRLSKPWLLAPYFPLSELSVASVIMMADSASSTPLESYPAIVVRAALDVRGLSGSLSRLCFAVGVGLLTCISVVSASSDVLFVLDWPVACGLGQTCFVQNYVDHGQSQSGEAKDFRCGSRTYANHDGTDIRLTDAQAETDGVAVLAAAAGRVTRKRDGVDDISIRSPGQPPVAGKECGNGLVIDHTDGWSTQYCHLKKGSVSVEPGDFVRSGDPIGKVGLSGNTEVPHLHLTVRHKGIIVDPFAYGQPTNACSGGRLLWTGRVADSFQYTEREIINFGFAEVVATMENIESGAVRKQTPNRKSSELVAYVRAIGLQKSDEQFISIRGPDGQLFSESRIPSLSTNKAEFFVSTGRRLTRPDWPQGSYEATYSVSNNGGQVLIKTFGMKIDQ